MLEGLTSAVDESVVLLVVRQLGRCATDDDLVTMVATQGLVPHVIRYTSQSEAPVHTIHMYKQYRKLRAELAVSSEVTSLLVSMADTR